jgi:hypothetical protein
MYIFREQEYRQTIKKLKEEIDIKGKKPLELEQELTD